MRPSDSQAIAGSLQNLFQFGAMGVRTDGQLMAHFLSGREGSQSAFEALVRRHGAMVLDVCRRVLGDAHLAEDAFQATFIVLARKAGTLRDDDLLAQWLHGVAYRVANKARSAAARRRVVERRAAVPSTEPGCALDRAELRTVIDEEIRRLPERYRVPVVLCYLEGLRHNEVARRIGCPVGTVESRLSRARERLRSRLVRRGLATTPAALAAIMTPSKAPAAIAPLVESTLQATARSAPGWAGGLAASATSAVGRGFRLSSWHHVGAVAPALVASVGVLAATFMALPVGMPGRPPAAPDAPPARVPDRTPPLPAVRRDAGTAPGVPKPPDRGEPPRPRRTSSALANPLAGISIDGRLDDWPEDLPRYPIRNWLSSSPAYRPEPDGDEGDPGGYFMAGYDREAGLINLAVVIRDRSLVFDGKTPWSTDAVEIYLDGDPTDPMSTSPHGTYDWPAFATKMPVLQYVAVPGPVAAFGDPWGNPALMYGKIGDTTTKMKYHRSGDLTTYEWAVQAFDRYPNRPTKLRPGKRIGLDIALVDKVSGRGKPAWICWGPPWRQFKGFDPENLGELILGDVP